MATPEPLVADYVIVGAGSAGCVLANRLSADGNNTVVLLEAGPPDRALSLRVPAAMTTNLKSRAHNWAYEGEAEPGLGGRRLVHDRGKTLGGSSSINGMVFIRGHAQDFDGWRQRGCTGWSYADVLPYFRRLENYAEGADQYRASEGPLHVSRATPETELAKAFLDAGRTARYPMSDDISGARQEGFAVFDRTIHKGVRWSTARAYLDPAKTRANLRVITGCDVSRITVSDRKAGGIQYLSQGGAQKQINARREVIVAAGAIGSPKLLLLSGIGDAKALRDLDIEPITHLPGVGQNLNDHPDLVMKFLCSGPHSIWPETRGFRKIRAGLNWMLRGRGPASSNHFDVVAAVRSSAGVAYPDLQLTLAPIAMDETGCSPIKAHAYQIHIGLMRAFSRGQVFLSSANPRAAPHIICNYLADSRDRDRLRIGISLVRELVAQPSLAALTKSELVPGPSVQDSGAMDAFLASHTASQWHLSGTCKMGPDTDKMAVVDPAGRVHGIQGLRIVDASIMPEVTNGNTNAPTIMIAEKLSDAILNRPLLKAMDAKVWSNPDWELSQR